ncbi:MAG: hypothetical protein EDM79_13165, partial [Chloroflexi bacterium]
MINKSFTGTGNGKSEMPPRSVYRTSLVTAFSSLAIYVASLILYLNGRIQFHPSTFTWIFFTLVALVCAWLSTKNRARLAAWLLVVSFLIGPPSLVITFS